VFWTFLCRFWWAVISTMKFFASLLAVGEATITLNLEKLTNFDAVAHVAADNIAISPVERMSFAGDIKASVDLFKGALAMVDSGSSSATVDCGASPYARYMPVCKNPAMKALAEVKKEGAGALFIDAETGKMGLRGHETGEGTDGVGYAVSFCAVVHIPVKSYPPPSMLKKKINGEMLAKAQAELNHMPHTEEGGVATFTPADRHATYAQTQGYAYGTATGKIHTDGGDPIEASFEQFRPEHAPYSAGWKRKDETYVADGSGSITFASWTSPASGGAGWGVDFSSCPEGTTTDIHAHPEAKRSLAALNVVVSQLRHNDDFAWLPEDPASLFIEEVEKQREEEVPEEVAEESQDSQLSPVVASFLAGVLGGGVVLAFFLFAQKRHRQEEYTALHA